MLVIVEAFAIRMNGLFVFLVVVQKASALEFLLDYSVASWWLSRDDGV